LELRRQRFGFCGLLSVPAEIFVSGGVRIMAENPLVSQIDDAANQDYLRKLAISLISSLGVDGAIHVCQANSWDGVLNWVMALGETGEARTSRA
jgi:hypothetical protein